MNKERVTKMLKQKAKKLNEGFRDLKDICVEELTRRINEDDGEISYFNLQLYAKFLSLYQQTKEYLEESSTLIDSMNEKIDELYYLINKKGS